MRSRRQVLTHLGLGAAGCALIGTAQPTAGAATKPPIDGNSPWWLVHPMTLGTPLGEGWRLSGLDPVRQGAAVMRIEHLIHGNLSIHICRHGGHPRGYASTEVFDLIVMDGGRGRRMVTPQLEAVFSRISDQIRLNELRSDRSDQLDDIQQMLTHTERVKAFGPPHL